MHSGKKLVFLSLIALIIHTSIVVIKGNGRVLKYLEIAKGEIFLKLKLMFELYKERKNRYNMGSTDQTSKNDDFKFSCDIIDFLSLFQRPSFVIFKRREENNGMTFKHTEKSRHRNR